MKKAAIWLIIAVSLVLLGGIIFVGALYMAGWDFKALGNNNYKTNTVDIAKEFQRISVVSDTEDVVFALSKDGNCKVVFYERDNEKHSASVVDNTLLITMRGHITCSKPTEYGPTIYDTFDCRDRQVEDVWLVE